MELDYEGRGTGLILHEFYDIDGQHEGQACAPPVAMTPIGAREIVLILLRSLVCAGTTLCSALHQHQ